MGRRGPKFEVERLQEERALLKNGEDASKDKGREEAQEDEAEEGTWRSWAESPRAMESMKYFVYVQSFVMFLTFGLPQLQKFWDMLQERLFS